MCSPLFISITHSILSRPRQRASAKLGSTCSQQRPKCSLRTLSSVCFVGTQTMGSERSQNTVLRPILVRELILGLRGVSASTRGYILTLVGLQRSLCLTRRGKRKQPSEKGWKSLGDMRWGPFMSAIEALTLVSLECRDSIYSYPIY